MSKKFPNREFYWIKMAVERYLRNKYPSDFDERKQRHSSYSVYLLTEREGFEFRQSNRATIEDFYAHKVSVGDINAIFVPPRIKHEKKKWPKQKKRAAKAKREGKILPFYSTWEWCELRYKVLQKYGAVCMCCGSTNKIVVDHIKPRSIYPALELDFDNMQVLCDSCNRGKSNKDYTDWRPKQEVTLQ